MAYKPIGVYRHDGHTFHPKLAYALPPGMGKAMVALGFFESTDDEVDIDMSGLVWDEKTKRADEVKPDEIVHPMGVA